MRFFILIFFIDFFSSAHTQANQQSQIDAVMQKIPDSAALTAKGIADYIMKNFSDQTDRAEALFCWIVKNIMYDIDNMFAVDFYQNSGEIVRKALKTRKGVCMHYAELFSAIANLSGIKSYVVTGYTRQNGSVDYLPHAWCAGLIDSKWYLFDPTWGSGYIQDSRVVRHINTYYFKTDPEKLVLSHMPFDPLWQFLNYPVTSQEFYEGETAINKQKPFFNYTDTLRKFENQSEIERLISSNKRIEKNGIINAMTLERLQHNKREIQYFRNKIAVDQYNKAVGQFNAGIREMNSFISYRNRQFTPLKSDPEIKQMVDTTENLLLKARITLKGIKNPDKNVASSITLLNRSIDEAMINLNGQKAFLDKYFRTGKLFRKSLFYKTTIVEIPVSQFP